ncbi:Uncharacterised protein [Nocardia africana]|uniref:Uncharacterized protein n=1 Tax=Nocardia africana TaxID=134964 RepID=A0A378WMF6_9NOCA|nr:Uncharacterised protein [Nocardia africana]
MFTRSKLAGASFMEGCKGPWAIALEGAVSLSFPRFPGLS